MMEPIETPWCTVYPPFTFRNMEKQIKDLEQKLAGANEMLKGKNEQIDRQESQINGLAAKLDNKQWEINEQYRTLENISKKNEYAGCAATSARLTSLEKMYDSMCALNATYKKQIGDLTKAHQKTLEENKTLKAQAEAVDTMYEHVKKERDELQERGLWRINSLLNHTDGTVTYTIEADREMRETIAILEKQRDELRADNAKLNDKIGMALDDIRTTPSCASRSLCHVAKILQERI